MKHSIPFRCIAPGSPKYLLSPSWYHSNETAWPMWKPPQNLLLLVEPL